MSTLYTFDFGFNWQSSEIGSAIGEPTSLFPLQYAVIKTTTGEPVWPTRFAMGDRVRFEITDITCTADQNPLTVGDTVHREQGEMVPYRTIENAAITFANPSDVGRGAYPFDSIVPEIGKFSPQIGNTGLPGLTFGGKDAEFQPHCTTSVVYNAQNADWRVARWFVGSRKGMTFANTPCFSEMSVRVDVSYEGATKSFFFDPELFVGDTEY